MKTVLVRILKRAIIGLILFVALLLPWRLRVLWAEKITRLNLKKGKEGFLDRFLFG
jgi:hypothetical protein